MSIMISDKETKEMCKDPMNWILKTAQKVSTKENVDAQIVIRAIMRTIITGKKVYIITSRKAV